MYAAEQDGAGFLYKSFMVRIWRPGNDKGWLASVEATHTHERHGFSDLQALFAFLLAQTGTPREAESSFDEPAARGHSALHLQPP